MKELISVGSLEEAMEKVSYRQYLAMNRWVKEQWNNPEKTEWQLMKLNREVRMSWLRDPNQAPPTETFQVEFNIDPPPDDFLSERERLLKHAENSQAYWHSMIVAGGGTYEVEDGN